MTILYNSPRLPSKKTKPIPTQKWSGIISYLFSIFETVFFRNFDSSICSWQTVLCSGANSRFSYTDSEYNYGATKIIFPIINQNIIFTTDTLWSLDTNDLKTQIIMDSLIRIVLSESANLLNNNCKPYE